MNVGGHDWIVYAAWKGAHVCGQDGNRNLLVDRIGWKNSWPSVNAGYPSQGRRAAPVVAQANAAASSSGDVCTAAPDGGYCSATAPGYAYICSGGSIVSTLECELPSTTCVAVAPDHTLTCN